MEQKRKETRDGNTKTKTKEGQEKRRWGEKENKIKRIKTKEKKENADMRDEKKWMEESTIKVK